MVLEDLLYKLYAIYDDYAQTHDHALFLEKLLSTLVAETQSEFGIITKKVFSESEGHDAAIDAFLVKEEVSYSTSLKIEKRQGSSNKETSFVFSDSTLHKDYVYSNADLPPIQCVQVYPIYLNREKTRWYICALGNRKGGYTVALNRQLPLVMRTLSLLLSHHEAEQNLQTHVHLLEQFVENVPAAVAMFDKDMRYLMTSKQWMKQEKNPAPAISIRGKSHYDVVQDIPQNWREEHQECLKGTILKRDEEKFIRADGSVQWLKWEIRPWYQKKEVGGLLMFVEHITESKEAEEHLRKTIEDLKQSKAQVERFAYMCSHDLKEPLRTIYSFLQLIKKESEEHITPQMAQYYDFIFEGVYQMRSLIENLLIYCELNPKSIQVERFPLSDIVDIVIKNNAHYILEKKVKIERDDNYQICGDKFLLTQVIHNLVSNACKYSKGQAPVIQIGCTLQDDMWEISVRDNGIGIAKPYHKAVFEKFTRVNKNLTTTSHGVGLAICKSIVDKHHGKIWVVSEADQGTTFFFTVPRSLKANPSSFKSEDTNVIQHAKARA